MNSFSHYEIWFVTGSQHLYGDEALQQVASHAEEIARGFDEDASIPVPVICQDTATTAEEIEKVCRRANSTPECLGLVFWMHTFSPAKMWIRGLSSLNKPFAHLHTQYNRDIPWESIDMDFMNLNQSAHGDREFGHIVSKMGMERTVIVGHWEDPSVREKLGRWSRAARALETSQTMKLARFGDNMRDVAVTEGDKVAAQMKLGCSVDGFGLGDLTEYVRAVSAGEADDLISLYAEIYQVDQALLSQEEGRKRLEDAASIEIGMRSFLEAGGYTAFTTTFENLHGLKQLPGLAVQRLMADGYGFGAEGDWKTAALTRMMKAAGEGLPGGTSFMEDYTYHLEPGNMMVMGAHMLEVCPTIAESAPSLEIHELGIGGKESPARLVFSASAGKALNASLVDMGDRFRLILNEVEAVTPPHELPRLPVARALWKPYPNLAVAAHAWILAGGAHHTVFSQALTSSDMEMFADMTGIECITIDEDTDIKRIKQELRWNQAVFS